MGISSLRGIGFATKVSEEIPSSKFFLNTYTLSGETVYELDFTNASGNVISWFKNKQPSTENLVLFIWEQIVEHIPDGANLYKIKLRETPTIYTEYYGPDGLDMMSKDQNAAMLEKNGVTIVFK